MNISFRIRNPKAEHSTLRLKVNFGNYKVSENGKKTYLPFETDLRFKIPTAYWNKNTRRLSRNKTFPHTEKINNILSTLEKSLTDYELECKRNGIHVDENGLTEAVNDVLANNKKERPKYLSDVFIEMIEKSETGERLTAKGMSVSPATIKKYKIALLHLENFEEIYGDVTLPMLNLSLGEQFQKYFNDLNMAHNTMSSMVKILVTAYNFAVKQGYMERTDFHKAKVREVATETLALSLDEVNKIYELKLQQDKELEKVRDIFIVGVWTLMRFSDYSTLKSFNIENNQITVITQKTKERVILPLHWQVKKLLAKYNSELPQAPSMTIFNRHLKEIAKLAKLEKMKEIRTVKGGKVKKKLKFQWELVSSHTARRTGATLLYLQGVPKQMIMLLTGHSLEKSFDRYIQIEKIEAVQRVAELDIYQTPFNANSQFEDGFYWVSKNRQTTIAFVKNGLLEFMKNRVVSLETWFEQKGEIVQKLNPPN